MPTGPALLGEIAARPRGGLDANVGDAQRAAVVFRLATLWRGGRDKILV